MIEIKEINDLETAKILWNKLSPAETIYDLWDFRFCFYENDPQPLRFLAAYDEGEAVALFPLQYNQELKCLEFFAENFMENNRPFFVPGYEYLNERFYAYDFGTIVKIYDLDGIDEFTKSLPLEDYIYYLDINDLSSFDDYLNKAFPNGHKRANFKRLFTNLERDHKLQVEYDNFNDLEVIMDLNVRKFGEESYLRTPQERQPFCDLLKLPLDWRAITLIVDGRKIAGSLSVIYQGTYYYLIVGSDISETPDAFKYLTKANLELALKEKAKIFNCSLGDCNWKSHWHLEKLPQYKFIK